MTNYVDVGARIVDLKPLIWNVIMPFDVNCPFIWIVCVEIVWHVPLKLATCEHAKDDGTVKYEGIDNCKYPGAS